MVPQILQLVHYHQKVHFLLHFQFPPLYFPSNQDLDDEYLDATYLDPNDSPYFYSQYTNLNINHPKEYKFSSYEELEKNVILCLIRFHLTLKLCLKIRLSVMIISISLESSQLCLSVNLK